MNFQKKKDLEMGTINENQIQTIIKEYFKCNDLKKLDKYNVFDFYSPLNELYFEVKSRRCNYMSYPTTIIGYNKFVEASKLNGDKYFVFIFNDGNYYYKYINDDKFDIANGGRNDRGKDEYKNYVYIPIEKLTKF